MPTVPVWWSVERDVPWSSTEQSFISYLHVISIKKLMISNFLFHNLSVIRAAVEQSPSQFGTERSMFD